MPRIQHGPGPIIQGQDITNPDRFIVQIPGIEGFQLLAQHDIAAIPITTHWFSGTANGLLATWVSREIAERHAQEIGVIYGQIKPLTVRELGKLTHPIPVLTDPNGRPLHGA